MKSAVRIWLIQFKSSFHSVSTRSATNPSPSRATFSISASYPLSSVHDLMAAAAAIKSWTDERGYEAEIEKVALEGEGFVADRVETLWKLLLNWINQIRTADFIFVACHSQGVPVG